MPVRSLDLAAQTNETSKETLGTTKKTLDGVKEMDRKVKEMDRKVDELTDGFKSAVPMLQARLTENARGPAALSASKYGEELQATLDTLRGGSDMEEAQKTLVRIALALVREDNERDQTIGEMTLNELVAHPNARNFVMDNPSVVRTLFDLAMKPSGDKAQSMLRHLVERKAPFFEQLKPLSSDPRYLPTIAATGLVPLIVKSARPMTGMQDGTLHVWISDENALRILLAMVECDKCKPAIAEAGGIAALVDTYPLLTMLVDEVNPLVFDMIRALVSLAEDSTCREQFARRGRCSTLSGGAPPSTLTTN